MGTSGKGEAGPEAGRAFVEIAPRSVEPVVLTCEHATRSLPPGIRPSAAERRILATHWGWDIGAWEMTRGLARRLGTSAIGGRWSRLWIDLNRRVDDPTLIRTRAADSELSWNRELTVAERERRVVAIHAAYHEAVDRLIIRRIVRETRPLLFAVHTFTDVFDGRRREFDAGVLFERDRSLAHRFGRRLASEGLEVRYNRPYSGMAGMMYSVDRHGKHHGLPCLELELNQQLFRRRSNVARLLRVTERAIRAAWSDREGAGF
jgi:predicted N-formylglutamate amidohydrolase